MMDKEYFQNFKKTLNSPSLCLAKWLWVTMHMGMGENHSCYHPPVHKWDLDAVKKDPRKLHNTDQKKQERKMMLEGKRPEGCNYCWNIEDLPNSHVSDRILKSSSHWAAPSLDNIRKSDWDNDNVYPTYLEVSFSNKCNFKCSYCSPGQSSRWEQEIIKFGSYPVRDRTVQKEFMHKQLQEDDNPFVDAFWEWFPEAYKHLKILRITGGEPLLVNSYNKLLDYVENNHNDELSLAINTNLGAPDRAIDRLIAAANKVKIKEFKLFTSIDSWGRQAEYIRHGLNCGQFERNITRIAEETNMRISFMVTFGALSVFNFSEFVEKVVDLKKRYGPERLSIGIAILTNPTHFDVGLLPPSFEHHFEKISNLITENSSVMNSNDIDLWFRLYDYWKVNREKDHTLDRIDFYRFFKEHDRRRDTNFLETFPELSQFWQHCKDLHEKDQTSI